MINDIELDFFHTLEKCQRIDLENCKKYNPIAKVAGQILRLIAPADVRRQEGGVMLFKQINILDENLKLQEDCYVAVRNGKIVSISAQRPAGEWEREYDGRGKLLMSGFYNAHAHSPMTLMRGYGENLKLQDWLNKKIFPFEAKLDGNAVYWGTMLALAESFRFGIVSTSDMYYFCDDMARAFADSGAKGNIARSIANVTGEDPCSLVSMQETKDFYRDYNGAENGQDPGGYEPSRGIHFGSGNRTCAG